MDQGDKIGPHVVQHYLTSEAFFRLVVSRGKAWSLQHFLKLWNLNQCPLLKMLMLGHMINTLIAKDVISPLAFIL